MCRTFFCSLLLVRLTALSSRGAAFRFFLGLASDASALPFSALCLALPLSTCFMGMPFC